MKGLQEKAEPSGNHNGQNKHEDDLPAANPSRFNLARRTGIGVVQPGNHSGQSHRRCHPHIHKPFARIRLMKQNDSIHQAEKNHKQLAKWIALGIVDQGHSTDQRSRQHEEIVPVKKNKRAASSHNGKSQNQCFLSIQSQRPSPGSRLSLWKFSFRI